MIGAIWSVATWPFRAIGLVLGLARRALGLTVGFALMVLGFMAASAGWPLLGWPAFLVGLLFTLRSLS